MQRWQPSIKKFNDIFTNEYSLKILTILSQSKVRMCTTEIAKLLEVHDSTAKRYLTLLADHNLIKQELVANLQGKPNFYFFNSKEVIIHLNFEYLSKSITESPIKEDFEDMKIRELPNRSSNFTYILDEHDKIHTITYKKRTKARKTITHHIRLSKDEMEFMKHLPFPTQAAENFLDICKKAHITDFYSIRKIMLFVNKIKELEIIEVKNPGDKGNSS